VAIITIIIVNILQELHPWTSLIGTTAFGVDVPAADAEPPPVFLSRQRFRPPNDGAPPPTTLCRLEWLAWGPSWVRISH